MKRKMGAIALSGMVVGPILGSGILIFPTLIYRQAHDWALVAWTLIAVVSYVVARIFGGLAIRFVGEAGASSAVQAAFGSQFKSLTSLFLVIGVLFGADAVLLTAAGYLNAILPVSPVLISLVLLILCALAIFSEVRVMARVAFVLSVVSSLFLFGGALASLVTHPRPLVFATPFAAEQFASSVFLLFWTVFGWEVMGNYSAEVRDPERTIPLSVLYSCLAIAAVSLTVAAAVQWSGTGADSERTLSGTVAAAYGGAGIPILAFLALFLCGSTYILYLGGAGRLMWSLAEDRVLPHLFTGRTRRGVPGVGTALLIFANIIVLGLVQFGLFDLAGLVKIANGFLVANALLGIAAGIVLLRVLWLRIAGVVIGLFFLGLLVLDSSIFDLVMIGAATTFFGLRAYANRSRIS